MNRTHLLSMCVALAACETPSGSDDDVSGDSSSDSDSDSDSSTSTDTSTDTGTGDSSTTDSDSDSGSDTGGDTSDLEAICEERGLEGCYYVSNTGNFPPGTEDRQLSMAEVSTHPFVPGDIILFARGDTWRQVSNDSLITLSSSGDEQDDLTFGAFGDGERPTFLGSIAASAWTEVAQNVWESATDIPVDPGEIGAGAELFFEREDGSALFGHREASSAGLDKAGDWTWAAGRVSVFAQQEPTTAYRSVEVPQAQRLIRLNNQQHLHFDSLRLRYMVSAGISDDYGNAAGLHGLRVSHSEIGYIGVKNSAAAYGLSLERSDVHIDHSEIHDCGRRSVSLVLYNTEASVIRDVVIENNYFHDGYHTTGVDVQSNTANGGSHLIENLVIRNNLFEGDPDYDTRGEDGHSSNHIFINEDQGAVLREIYIYNNLFTYAQGSGIKTSGGQDFYIHHNTFYGFNPSYDNFQAQIVGGTHSAHTVIVNNVFYNDATDSSYACIEYAQGQAGEYTIDRNLYFASSYDHARLLWVADGTSYFFDDDWDNYQAATGFDANSPMPGPPPDFVDAPGDLRPGASSPAVGKAEPVDWIPSDYHGDPMHRPPDLGAIQHSLRRQSGRG